MHLANALHRRGFKIVVYWLGDRNPALLAPGIRQRVLVRSFRYYGRKPSNLLEAVGRILDFFPQRARRRYAFHHPDLVIRLLRNFINSVCQDDPDPGAVRRLVGFMALDGVTHVMPTLAMICPLARAAKESGRHQFDFLVSFQGEEVFASHIKSDQGLDVYYRELRRSAEASPWLACALSRDYAGRLSEEIGIKRDRITVIYAGIALPRLSDHKPSFDVIVRKMPWIRRDVPIVTYFGRQDSEKGIDLLLYAARMLKDRNVAYQLVICGGSSFGKSYHEVCRQIGRHLRLSVYWNRHVDDEFRAALFSHSRCVVCPSIHDEPFGMVAPEAMAQGTPVLVPDRGGITETISVDGVFAGLTFRAWDTASLAEQLEKLLTNDALHASLAANCVTVARHFSIEAMTDRILMHLGLPLGPHPGVAEDRKASGAERKFR